jgi:non-heme chloroperoxidase
MIASGSTVTLASGIRLSYATSGSGSGPVVVLLPGPTDSWRSYSPVLDLLPSPIRTVAVSQRGHGDSDKPASGYRVADFAADVVSLLDELGIERAVLAGHSGSCLVARRVAIDHAERVAGLLLEASPMTLEGDARLERFVTSVVSALRDPIDPAFARSFVADTSSGALQPELLDQLVDELLQVPARAWKEMFADLLLYDDLTELRRIVAPTLLIWGDADVLVGRDMQDTLAELIGGAELRVYEGVGHTPRWEQPTRFADDLAQFVEWSFGRDQHRAGRTNKAAERQARHQRGPGRAI